MVVIRLAGGLGNQIFQMGAALLLLQERGKKNTKLLVDDTALSSYFSSRESELINFFQFDESVQFKKVFYTKFRLPKIITNQFFVSDKNYPSSLKCDFSYMLLDGYFQDCFKQNQFEKMTAILRSKFITIINKPLDYSSVVIHIRGGDFISLGWDSICNYEYYQSAIDFFKKQHGISNFIVVTDDRFYASKLMQSLGVKCVFTNGNAESDFHTISKYPNRILSSSTFSFWASVLGENPINACVIAPKMWNPKRIRNITLPNEVLDI